jgi:DNA-binding GntR family transcriptional regulator
MREARVLIKTERQKPIANTELIANALREAISVGDIPAGTPLKQDEIAAQFEVSHTPVREALKLLTSEGLAVSHHNRGVCVAELSAEVARELIEFRCLLEPRLAAWAMPNLRGEDIAAAATLIKGIEKAKDIASKLALASRFHTAIYQRANRPFFLAQINNVRNNLGRYWRLVWEDKTFAPDTQEDHRAIVRLCKAGDADALAAFIEGHVRRSGDVMIAFIEAHQRLAKSP